MSNWNTRFTALGLSGVGKTCYIMGMYSEMVSGIRGWTVKTVNADADKLARQLKRLENQTGGDRFPTGTQDYAFDDYEFDLYFRNHEVMQFHWVDYAGGILEQNDLNHDTAQLLGDSILCSTTLYIFIDGSLLRDGTTKQKIKKVKRNCGDYINPKIVGFIKQHEKEMPPIVFVITKSDLCNHTSLEEIQEILTESFSTIFYSEEMIAYIVTASLGEEIAEDNYSGMLDPINIQTPFFIGIAHDFFNKCALLVEEIEQDNYALQEIISVCEEKIDRDEKAISVSQKSIDDARNEIEERHRENQNKEKENLEFQKKIEKAKKLVKEKEKQIKDQKEIVRNNTGWFWFSFSERVKKRQKAEENIQKYTQQKKDAASEARWIEKKRTANDKTIGDNQSKNQAAEEDINDQKDAILAVKLDIKQQSEKIEELEERIQCNMEKRQKYTEMLADITEELEMQRKKHQFIAIQNQQEFIVHFDLE